MKIYTPLTIDKAATRERIIAGEKQLKLYAKRRGIVESLFSRVLAEGKSAYPVQEHRKSKYQAALRKLAADGYLVQLDQPLDLAA